MCLRPLLLCLQLRGSAYNCTDTMDNDRDYVIVNIVGKTQGSTAQYEFSRADTSRFMERHRSSVAREQCAHRKGRQSAVFQPHAA